MSFEYVFDGSTFVFKAKENSESVAIENEEFLHDNPRKGSATLEARHTSDSNSMSKGNLLPSGVDSKVQSNRQAQTRSGLRKNNKRNRSGKQMASKSVLQTTTRIEERGFRAENDSMGQRKYFCNHCDYKILNYKRNSTYAAALIRDHHNAVHLQRVLQCTECAYTTLKYKSMQGHRNITHGLPAMKCTECVNTFIVEEDLIEHYKVKHNILKEPSDMPKKGLVGEPRMPNGDRIPGLSRPQRKPRVAYQGFTSTRTGVKKSWKPGSQRLYSYIHTCDTCGFQARLINVIKGHMNKAHTGKLIKCPDCNFQSHYMVNLTKHLKDAHKKMAEHCIAPGCKFKSIFPSKVQLHLFYKHHGRYDQERHSILIPIP